MILLKNGLVWRENQLVKQDVLIENKQIVQVADEIVNVNAEIIDVAGHLVMPGAIDVHVHFREPGYTNKETIETGSLSAAKGGVTTVLTMPNLKPAPDCMEGLQTQLDIIQKNSVVKCYPYGCVSKGSLGKEIVDFESLAPHVIGFTDDGRGVNNISLLHEAMEKCYHLDELIASHAEDERFKTAPAGEFVAVRREIALAKEHCTKYHFCHMSTKESFKYIKEAQEYGFPITCEVSPHHLFLCEEDIKGSANFKMNPPLRTREDMQATKKALLSGVATVIASDHAPHTVEEKKQEYEKCPNGIVGLETLLPLVYTHLVRTKEATIGQMIDWVVYNPARIFNLEAAKIEAGSVADICVLDIENEHIYQEKEILSKGKNSPFIGWKLYGFNVLTIVDGKIVYQER